VEVLLRGGASTRDRATTVSGRGVGLDIVRNAVGKVQGSLDVRWEAGLGTTFTIRTPVSLATSRVVLVRVQSWVLAFPTAYVDRLLRPDAATLRRSQGQQVLVTDEGTVPLAPLARVLGPPFRESVDLDSDRIVVLRSGRTRAAFLVDALLREEEMVVRPAVPAGVRTPLVGAAAMLPSGEVVPVLNVGALLDAGASAAYGPELPAPAAAEPAARRPRVLVVDDSITTRTLERSILDSAGFEADAVVDGAEAWTRLREHEYDLVVADVEMPRMDGFELCRAIRASTRLRDLPVILVTAREGAEDRQRGLDAGADAYIAKSAFDQAELLETARQLLGGGEP
jgi:two-component system chemotaxis sensor kinase CheA